MLPISETFLFLQGYIYIFYMQSSNREDNAYHVLFCFLYQLCKTGWEFVTGLNLASSIIFNFICLQIKCKSLIYFTKRFADKSLKHEIFCME